MYRIWQENIQRNYSERKVHSIFSFLRIFLVLHKKKRKEERNKSTLDI